MDRETDILDYMQGRMTAEQRARFEVEMASDPGLDAEIRVLQAARSELGQAVLPAGAMEAGWARLSPAITPAANENRAPLMRYLQVAAAAAFVAVGTWQFAIAPAFLSPTDGSFRAASQSSAEFALTVVFQDSAPVAEMTAFLLEIEGTVVEGPSALGTYTVRFADEAARDTAADVARSRTGIVASVFMP